jgi:hypothetical protein
MPDVDRDRITRPYSGTECQAKQARRVRLGFGAGQTASSVDFGVGHRQLLSRVSIVNQNNADQCNGLKTRLPNSSQPHDCRYGPCNE